jgi:tRNA A37 methylthiotransferase MiaB
MATQVSQLIKRMIKRITEMLPTLTEELLSQNFKRTSDLLEEIKQVEEGMSILALRLSDSLEAVEYVEEGIRIHESNPTQYRWEVHERYQDEFKMFKNDVQEGIINILTEMRTLEKHNAELKKLRDELSMLNERMIVVEYFKEYMKNLWANETDGA